MSQITLKDFRRGLANPADWNEAETLLNLVPLRDGSLERRPGLNTLDVALTTGGGSPITPEANRNIFWHERAGIWIVCGGDGKLYTANPTTEVVAQAISGNVYAPRRQQITDFPANAMIYGTGWFTTGGSDYSWQCNVAGTIAQGPTVANQYRCRASNSLFSAATGVTASSLFAVTDGVTSASDTIGGIGYGVVAVAPYGEGFLIAISDGTLKMFGAGDINRRGYTIVGKLQGESFLPYTFRETPFGVFFCTTKDAYLFNGTVNSLTRSRRDANNSFFEAIPTANVELATAEWIENLGEFWYAFEDSSSNWQTYIYTPASEHWRKFSATLFDNGSLGIRNGDLYIALKGYGATVPGIYLVHGTNKADPNGDITCSYGHGYVSAKEGDEWDMELAAVYWIGAGWGSTLTLTYEDEAGAEQTATLTRDTYHRYLPPSLILARRMKTLGSTTIATSEPTKAVDLREITYFYTPRQRRA